MNGKTMGGARSGTGEAPVLPNRGIVGGESLNELIERFGLRLIVRKFAEETFSGGPEFLFVVHLGVIGDLLEVHEGAEGGAGGVEFENAAVMVETIARELNFQIALFSEALFEVFVAENAIIAREDLEGWRRKFRLERGGEGGLLEEVAQGRVRIRKLGGDFIGFGELGGEKAFAIAADRGGGDLDRGAVRRRL